MTTTHQSVTGVGTMTTLVRFGACMQSHVSPQVRAEFRLKIAVLVSAGMDLDLLVARGILVPYPMPRENEYHFKAEQCHGNRRS